MGELQSQYQNMFPRLLNAVTTMAKITGSLRERLAWVAGDVTVFAESTIPPSVVPPYREFCNLVASGKVPEAYQRYHHPVRSTPAFHISPVKAKKAAEILTNMFEKIASFHGWTEEELRQLEEERS